MIDFKQGPQEAQGPPTPLSWDYCKRFKKDGGAYWALQSENDLALCTCSNGHTSRMTGSIHRVGPDGTVTPSYVCPVTGCTFHEWVRLVGFDATHMYEVVILD